LPTHRTREVHKTSRTVNALRRLAKATGARVVVSNLSKGHVYGGLAARAAGLPAVFWQQGIPGDSLLERLAALVPAETIVCLSDPAVEAQRSLAPTRRILKIHLGVPVQEIAARRGSGAAIRRALEWERHPLVGIVGRLEPWKGQDVFLRAAARVSRSHPDARFLVVGGAILGWEGDYPDDLRRLAAELGLGDRVHFAGHQADVQPWFDALDVVVHASLGEPFGLVLVEAMALGKPLVAAAAGGPLEIVEDWESGLLVPPGDPATLAGSLVRVLDDPALASALGRGATKRANSFSEERTAERFADVLGRAADRRRPARSQRPGIQSP
jgi:glycosyltransferase involved in cell wall biosynthesis